MLKRTSMPWRLAVLLATYHLMGGSSPAGELPPKAAVADRFVVHEWGTFTSFSGSDGVKLDFRPLVDNDLPYFVLDRAKQSGYVNPFRKVNLVVRQRMETPVTYFYTESEREVQVRVRFPQGLLTEFYPPVAGLQPKYDAKSVNTPLEKSALDWGTVRLIPPRLLTPALADARLANHVQRQMELWLPPPAQGNPHYQFARETDSALVHVHRQQDISQPMHMSMPKGDYFEKFLFYRGVGNFELPLHCQSQSGGQFVLHNNGSQAIGPLYLVTVDKKGIRFAQYDGVQPNQTLTLSQSSDVRDIETLSALVVESLVATGLYEKEAVAMVKTWSTSWFGEMGTRLFYMVPEQITNELLPLEIVPPPEEMIRVLVGRMELMTPENEAHVMALVRESAAQRAAARAAAIAAKKAGQNSAQHKFTFPPMIHSLGRLAEPALVRVKNIADDGTVRAEASQLLTELNNQRLIGWSKPSR